MNINFFSLCLQHNATLQRYSIKCKHFSKLEYLLNFFLKNIYEKMILLSKNG